MTQIEDDPTQNVYNGEIGSKDDMKFLIMTEARRFVDKHVSIDIPEIPQYGKQSNSLKCRFCGIMLRQAKKTQKT